MIHGPGAIRPASELLLWQVVLVLALTVACNAAVADRLADFSGPEFLVNTTTWSDQRVPAVSIPAAGDSAIIWQSLGQAGVTWSVFAQRLDKEAGPVGTEFRLTEAYHGPQDGPHLTHRVDGTMTAVWQGRVRNEGPRLVFMRHFDQRGQPRSGDLLVSTERKFTQILPRVTAAGNDNLAVTWSGNSADGDGYGILARFYDAGDQPLADPFVVNQFSAGAQRSSDVAAGVSGPVVIAWQSSGQISNGWGIIGRCFSTTGEAITDEFPVSQSGTGSQSRPRVAGLPDGRFLIAWQDNAGQGQYRRVMARAFDADCQPVTGEFMVNQFDAGVQDFADVDAAGPAHFIVAWQSYDPDDFDRQGIYARRLAATGEFTGDEFPVSQEPEAYQDTPAVAGDVQGGFLVTWESLGQDGSGYGILARRYFPPTAGELEPLSERERQATAGQPLPEALELVLTDQWGEPLGGIPVIFTGPDSGPGMVFDNGHSHIELFTDSQGRVAAGGMLAPEPGRFTVSVTVAGDGPAATFSIESMDGSPAPVAVPGPAWPALLLLLAMVVLTARRPAQPPGA